MADSLLNEDNQTSDEREALINKWKDKSPEELLKAKVESDLYVKTLTSRFDDLSKDYIRLRDEHQASTDLKTLIDQVKNRANQDTSTTTQVEPVNQSLKPEEIASLIDKQVTEKLTQRQLIQKQEENLRSVQAKLKETFGEDYQSSYKQRLNSLGLTPEYADDLAKNYPAVFLKTFDLEGPKAISNNTLPRTTQRPGFAPTTPKRDWNYYQELKKSNPKLYLDPKIAIQMHNDAIELGSAFGMPD
jgi:hypothetical protein